jgi:hypothetical protein
MICFARPELTEDLCSEKGRIINNMLYVRNVHLTKDQTHHLIRGDVTEELRGQIEKSLPLFFFSQNISVIQ